MIPFHLPSGQIVDSWCGYNFQGSHDKVYLSVIVRRNNGVYENHRAWGRRGNKLTQVIQAASHFYGYVISGSADCQKEKLRRGYTLMQYPEQVGVFLFQAPGPKKRVLDFLDGLGL